jgi:hypothetical protein
VFSTYKPLEDLVGEDILYDFYQFVAGHIVYLPLLDKQGLDFRIAYMEKVSGKRLNKETTDAILNQTAGHPNLTRLGIEAVIDARNVILSETKNLNQKKEILRVAQDDIVHFLLEQKPIKAALLDIWKSLSPSEQNSLTAVILSEAKNLDPSVASLSQDDSPNGYLQNIGLIKNGKITIPLFAQFLKQFDRQSSHIAFDLNTLSDALTSSEFKLLTFLSQNSNRVIEREEVINAVWKDNKSSAGVTDQALDQLIFRLRKKIEDDPNKPAHLETIKGRGFKFTQ